MQTAEAKTDQNSLIRMAAARMGVSVSELARRIDCPRRTVASWQAAERPMPGPVRVLLERIAAGEWRL